MLLENQQKPNYCSFENNMFLETGCFKDLFVFNVQQFYNDLSKSGIILIYPAWFSLEFLNPWIEAFHHLEEFLIVSFLFLGLLLYFL